MPPKKKNPPAKILKPAQAALPSSEFLEATSVVPIQRPQIPKKPLYRVIKCENVKRARLIQVKGWKAHSLYIADYGEKKRNLEDEKDNNICSLLASKTAQKSLKGLRRLGLTYSRYFLGVKKFLSQKFRLEKLKLDISIGKQEVNIIRGSIHPTLKSLSLKSRGSIFSNNQNSQKDSWEDHAKLLTHFQHLEQLEYDSYHQRRLSFKPCSPVPQLQMLKRLHYDESYSSFLLEPKLSKHYKALQQLSITGHTFDATHPLFQNLALLPKIHTLFLSASTWTSSSDQVFIDFALFSRLTALESLSLKLTNSNSIQINDLDFLANLKKFSIKKDLDGNLVASSQSDIINKIKVLPKLESLKIEASSVSAFEIEMYKTLVSKSQNLKSLKIIMPLQELNYILEESTSELSLEKLSLGTSKISRPFRVPLENIVSLLKEQKGTVKTLKLSFKESQSDFVGPIIKAVGSFSGLETFQLSLRTPVELEDRKAPPLKDLISKQENLKSVRLFLSSHFLDSRDVKSLTTALRKCQKLEELTICTEFTKANNATFSDFMEFLRNAKTIKMLSPYIGGLSGEQDMELKKILGHDISLWKTRY